MLSKIYLKYIYISLYNNWSYNISDEWEQIYELSQNSDDYDNMKKEIQELLKMKIGEIDFETDNIELTLLEKAEKIDGTNNLHKVIINVLYKEEGYNYDDEVYLVKIKDIAKQSTLSKKQRKENVKGAYDIKRADKIYGKKVILFDDIYTTGSTVNAISKILKENGAKEIIILTIAKD